MHATARSRRPGARNRRHGFSTVELILAGAIIGLLALLAVPFFRRAQDATATSSCVNNLRSISIAKEMYAIERNAPNGAKVPTQMLNAYLKVPLVQLEEPNGGEYKVNVIGVDPVCSIGPPHVLP